MRIKITEGQFRKIFKGGEKHGPFSKVIYNILEDVLDDPNVCDYVVTYIDIDDMYVILIATEFPTSSSFESKIIKLVSDYVGIIPFVLVNDNSKCKKTEN